MNLYFKGEKVRTTKIRTSKTKKNSENSVDDQNVEMVFLVDQNVESQKTTFDVVIILNAIGKIRMSKV